MSGEAEVIKRSARPVTRADLDRAFAEIGFDGRVTIVHSSLSAIGWVAGGAQSVVEALLAAAGRDGTLVMATQSGQLSDPAKWQNPPVPADWVDEVRDGLPAFDPHLTSTRGMGQIVDTFRSLPAVRRSSHPLMSFAAHGPLADTVVEPHELTPAFGPQSPLGRLVNLDAQVVLLGVDHGSNTSLHLAEYLATWPRRQMTPTGAPVSVDGQRRWVVVDDLDYDTDDFPACGEAWASGGGERRIPVGQTEARVSDVRPLVEFATEWFSAHRSQVATT